MLPFLAKKKDAGGIAGTIIKNREPDQPQDESSESEPEYDLADCCKDIISCIQSNDHQGLADALREAFEKLESEPHQEAPENSFQAQNEEAAD